MSTLADPSLPPPSESHILSESTNADDAPIKILSEDDPQQPETINAEYDDENEKHDEVEKEQDIVEYSADSNSVEDDVVEPPYDESQRKQRPNGADPYARQRRAEGDGPVRQGATGGDSSVEIEEDDDESDRNSYVSGSSEAVPPVQSSSSLVTEEQAVTEQAAPPPLQQREDTTPQKQASSTSSTSSSSTSSSSLDDDIDETYGNASKEDIQAALHSFPPFRIPTTNYRRFNMESLISGGKGPQSDWRVPLMFSVGSRNGPAEVKTPQPPSAVSPLPAAHHHHDGSSSSSLSSSDDDFLLKEHPAAAPPPTKPVVAEAAATSHTYYSTPDTMVKRREDIRAMCARLQSQMHSLQEKSKEEQALHVRKKLRRDQRLAALHASPPTKKKDTDSILIPTPPTGPPQHMRPRSGAVHPTHLSPSAMRSVYQSRPFTAQPTSSPRRHATSPPSSGGNKGASPRRCASANYAKPTASSTASRVSPPTSPTPTSGPAAKRGKRKQRKNSPKSHRAATPQMGAASSRPKPLSPTKPVTKGKVRSTSPPTRTQRKPKKKTKVTRSHSSKKKGIHPPGDLPLSHSTPNAKPPSPTPSNSMESSFQELPIPDEQPVTYHLLTEESQETPPSRPLTRIGASQLGGYEFPLGQEEATVEHQDNKSGEKAEGQDTTTSYEDATELAAPTQEVTPEAPETAEQAKSEDQASAAPTEQAATEPEQAATEPEEQATDAAYPDEEHEEPETAEPSKREEQASAAPTEQAATEPEQAKPGEQATDAAYPDEEHEELETAKPDEPISVVPTSRDLCGRCSSTPLYWDGGSSMAEECPILLFIPSRLPRPRPFVPQMRSRHLEHQVVIADEDELTVNFDDDPNAVPVVNNDPFAGVAVGSHDMSSILSSPKSGEVLSDVPSALVRHESSSDMSGGVTIMVGSSVVVAATPIVSMPAIYEPQPDEPVDSHLDFFAEVQDRGPSGSNTGSEMEMEYYDDYEEDEFYGGDIARNATEQFKQAKLRRLNSGLMDHPPSPHDEDSIDEQEKRRRRQQVRFVSTHNYSATREGGVSPTDTNDTAAPPSRCESPSHEEGVEPEEEEEL